MVTPLPLRALPSIWDVTCVANNEVQKLPVVNLCPKGESPGPMSVDLYQLYLMNYCLCPCPLERWTAFLFLQRDSTNARRDDDPRLLR